MMNRAISSAAFAAMGLLIAYPASAACSLKTQPIPVKVVGFKPMITAKVNGKTGAFLLDSGSAINQMSAKFAQAQKLPENKASDNGPTVVKAPKFEFAGSTLNDVPFVESDKLTDVDGVIGQTVLRQADVEYEYNALGGTVKLAKAEGCEGVNMAYWAKEGQAYSEAPLEPLDKDAPFTKTEVIVNGVKLRGMLVSGVAYTMLTEKAAAKAGVKTSDPGVKTFKAGNGGSVWIANFKTVQIGDEEIANAPLEIGQTSDDFYDVLIGGDFLTAHHLYVANSQQKIYFTYAGLPNVPVFKAHEPVKVAVGMLTSSGAGIKVH